MLQAMVRSHHTKMGAEPEQSPHRIRFLGYGRERRPPAWNSVESTPTDLFSAMARPWCALVTGNALSSGFSFLGGRGSCRRELKRLPKIAQVPDSGGKPPLPRQGPRPAVCDRPSRRYRA